MSHGTENKIYARNARYDIEDLWEPFTADKCPGLAGKPKLFFIQVNYDLEESNFVFFN